MCVCCYSRRHLESPNRVKKKKKKRTWLFRICRINKLLFFSRQKLLNDGRLILGCFSVVSSYNVEPWKVRRDEVLYIYIYIPWAFMTRPAGGGAAPVCSQRVLVYAVIVRLRSSRRRNPPSDAFYEPSLSPVIVLWAPPSVVFCFTLFFFFSFSPPPLFFSRSKSFRRCLSSTVC